MFYGKTAALVMALSSTIAHADDSKLGTRKNPLKLVMVPSTDSTKILSSMKPVAQCLEKETGLNFDISVPNSYIVAIEGMGSKKSTSHFFRPSVTCLPMKNLVQKLS